MLANILAWVAAHQLLIGGFVVALADLLFALKPDWKSNGILHWFYVQAQALAGKPAA